MVEPKKTFKKKEKKQSLAVVYTLIVILFLLLLGLAGACVYGYMMIMPKVDDAEKSADQAYKKGQEVSNSFDAISNDIEDIQEDIDDMMEDYDKKIEDLSQKQSEPESNDSGERKEFSSEGFPFTFSYNANWMVYEPGDDIAGNKVRSNEIIFLNEETKAEYDRIQEEGLETEGPQAQLIVKSYPGNTIEEVEEKYITNDATKETKEEIQAGEVTAYKYKMEDSLYEDDYIYLVQKDDDVIEFTGPDIGEIEEVIGTMK